MRHGWYHGGDKGVPRAAETTAATNVERLRVYVGLCDQAARIEDADRLAGDVRRRIIKTARSAATGSRRCTP